VTRNKQEEKLDIRSGESWNEAHDLEPAETLFRLGSIPPLSDLS